LKAAILIGVSKSEYEAMTPYELNLAIEAYGERRQAEIEENVTMAWLGEYYHRMKRLKPIKDILKEMNQTKNKNMDDKQMLDMVKHLNAQFGGTIESGE
jgi:hypothetical protein